jgi:transposase
MLLAVTPDCFIPDDHPIRRIKPIVESALARLSPVFDAMYAERGRPSIPPEHLLKASLLIALYSIRSERQFCERLRYDLLFKWFLDLNVSDEPFDASSFSKNRERLLEHDVSRAFFAEVVAEARRRRLLSADHFTVDGTLLEAWASLKSYRPRDEQDPPSGAGGGRNREVDFRGQRRRRETHASSTDPQAQLYTKGSGQTAKLCYMGHLLTENRHGLVLDVELTEANGHAERAAALAMLDRCTRGGATLGADRGYDSRDFVAGLRARGVTPHVAQHESRRRSAVDGRTTRHAGYGHSQRRRKLVEQVYGWMKTVGGGRKLRFLGLARNRCWLEFTAAAYNLVRMAKLEAAAA